jgi:hypothetical protein
LCYHLPLSSLALFTVLTGRSSRRDTLKSYIFTGEDVKHIRWIAKDRDRGKSILTTKYIADNNLIGAYGEYAFAKLYGYEATGEIRFKGDGGIDFENNLFTIQVKSTHYQDGSLSMKPGKFIACLAVLFTVDIAGGIAEMRGWIGKEDFLKRAKNPKWAKWGDIAVDQSDLCTWTDWMLFKKGSAFYEIYQLCQ